MKNKCYILTEEGQKSYVLILGYDLVCGSIWGVFDTHSQEPFKAFAHEVRLEGPIRKYLTSQILLNMALEGHKKLNKNKHGRI